MDKATYIQTINIMGNDVFIYKTRFPGTDIYEAVMPCFGGYTIYLDDRLSPVKQQQVYRHALHHIKNGDFEKYDVSEIELEACELCM